MKKKILLIILFISNFAFCQFSSYQKGEVFFRNGTSEKGLIKRKLYTIKFKNKTTKTIELDYKKIKGITIIEDGKEHEYVYKIIKGKKKGKFKLLKIIISGKISLYAFEHETTVGGNNSAPIFLTYNHKGANYYLGKNNSNIVDFVGANSIALGRKSIKKGLIKYFYDCEMLVKKIKNKDFKNKDILKVVDYYNKNCKQN